MLYILDRENSIATKFLNELRDINIQHDSMRFRRNLERLGECLAYEMSKSLMYKSVEVQTPLAVHSSMDLGEHLVVTTILRAGLPMYQGVLNMLDRAESAFIAAYRVEGDGDVTIQMEYVASGNLDGKTVILVDPMLATGGSLVQAFHGLLRNGRPAGVHILAAIASEAGVSYVQEQMQKAGMPCHIWVGAVDAELNHKSYIVPGLGDAGDLAFGPKL